MAREYKAELERVALRDGAHGLKRVEAGAQGPHKIQRGYLPSATYSAHWIADKSFRDAVEQFLEEERQGVEYEMKLIAKHSPFRKGDGG